MFCLLFFFFTIMRTGTVKARYQKETELNELFFLLHNKYCNFRSMCGDLT